MANKRFYQFLYSKQPKLTLINGLLSFGATGAVTLTAGAGVASVTKLATGIYKLKMVDNYVAFLGAECSMLSGVTGSNVTAGSFATGTIYQITALGTTTQAQWVTAGMDPDYTAAVGSVFVGAAAGAGTGTAKALIASNVQNIEVAQVQSSMLNNLNANQGRGAAIILNLYGLPASGQVPALTEPLTGSQMSFKIWFKDSTVLAF